MEPDADAVAVTGHDCDSRLWLSARDRAVPIFSLSAITSPTNVLRDDPRSSHPALAAAHVRRDLIESCVPPIGLDEQRHRQLPGVMAARAPAAGGELKAPIEQAQGIRRPAEAACFALRIDAPHADRL